jgi:hypothetical protein
MRQLQSRHILFFRILRDHCSFLTREQIQRILTLSRISTTKTLLWMLAEQYLNRRYRADTFVNFQTPVYYLGRRGWHVVGKAASEYGAYRLRVEQTPERTFRHTLALYSVIVKFLMESRIKRVILSDDRVWQDMIELGNIPDAWIQFGGGEVFIEVDLGTEHAPVLKKKFDNYIAFKESGRYGHAFPGCQFRILVFTPSEPRIEELEQVASTGDIWFCTMKEFWKKKLSHRHWFSINGCHALSIIRKKEVQRLR